MKKILIALTLVLVMATSGWAYSVTYDLVYKIDGGPPVSYIGSLGTVTISDNTINTNWVDVVIDLNTYLNLQAFYLNYNGIENITNLTLTGTTLSVSKDNKKPDGYKGKFDIEIPATGNLTGEDFNGTFKADQDLNAISFDVLDTLNLFHVAVHIGEGTAGLPGGVNSLWAGDGTPVPEPTTLLLLGLGLIGIAGVGRKLKK